MSNSKKITDDTKDTSTSSYYKDNEDLTSQPHDPYIDELDARMKAIAIERLGERLRYF